MRIRPFWKTTFSVLLQPADAAAGFGARMLLFNGRSVKKLGLKRREVSANDLRIL